MFAHVPSLVVEMLKWMLSSSFSRVGNCGPQAHTVTLSPRYLDVPLCQTSHVTIPPPPQPPTLMHLIGHHSQREVQDTCEGPGQCHRVFSGEPLMVQYTAEGSRPVPLFCHVLPLGCPYGLRS